MRNKIKLLRVITTRVIVIFIGLTLIASCGIYKKTDARKIPMKASDRAKNGSAGDGQNGRRGAQYLIRHRSDFCLPGKGRDSPSRLVAT